MSRNITSRPSLVLALSLLLILFLSIATVEGCHLCSKKRAFAEISCKSTRYRKECVETLLSHINSTNYSPQELAQISLQVSLRRARLARAYVAKLAYGLKKTSPLEHQAACDCIDQIGHSMARISQSIQELQNLKEQDNGVDFLWHSSNLETWASAALTDLTTCFDALPGSIRGRSYKDAVKMRVNNVVRITSNALAMVNRFVTRQRVVRGP